MTQRTILKATGKHDWGTWIEDKKATCEEYGTKHRSCNVCGAKDSQNITPPGHNVQGQQKKVDPTCGKDGYTVTVCSTCGKEMTQRTVLKATGKHDWGTWIEDKKATCEEYGAKHRSCNVCGQKDAQNINPLGHTVNGQQKKVDPTCGKDGYTVTVCSTCGKEMTQRTILKATGKHDWGTWITDKKENCTETGVKHHVCNVCGTATSETIPAKGHSVNGQIRRKNPTCYETGYTVTVCSDCGREVGARATLPKKEHNYGKTVYAIISPTCEYNGWGYKTCVNEGCTHRTYMQIDKKNHNPIPFVEYATCSKTGKRGVKCEKCGQIIGNYTVLPIDATAHIFGKWEIVPDACSAAQDVYVRTCKGCGETETKTVDKDVQAEYYIHFDANGGTGKMDDYVFTGMKYKLGGSKFNRPGYEFTGWSNSPSSYDGMFYAVGDEILRDETPLTVYAVWEPIYYQIEYFDNYEGAPASHIDTIPYGSDWYVYVPEREGYEFLSWKGIFDGHQIYMTGGQKIKNLTTIKNAKIQVYAQWKKMDSKYTVTFRDGDRFIQTLITDLGKKTKTIPYSKNGSSILGWSTTKGGSVQYESGKKYEFKGDTVLYAVWASYTVTYDANGGSKAPDPQTITDGSTVFISTKKLTRDGYTFEGWSYTKDEGIDFYPGKEYSDGVSITLYAVWKPIEYTLRLEWGYLGSKTIDVTLLYDTVYYLSVPTRKGYVFTGWKGAYNGRMLSYGGSDTVSKLTTIDGSTVTLIANWKKGSDWKAYTITYDANGGTGAPKKQEVPESDYAIISKDVPDRPGYKFGGWSFDSSSDTSDFNGGDKYKDGVSIKLYAVWTPIEYYLQLNDGYFGGKTNTYTMPYDYVHYLSAPKRKGYKFVAWKGASDGKQLYFSDGAGVSGLTVHEGTTVILTAYWAKENDVVEVKFYDGTKQVGLENGFVGDKISMMQYAHPDSGKKCIGWNTSKDGNGKNYNPGTKYEINESITLYAVWGYYTIRYDANGGTGGPGVKGYSNNVVATISGEIPSRTGYRFNGWSYFKDATEGEFSKGDTYSYYESITLYATWLPIEYKVSYNPNYAGADAISSETCVYDYPLIIKVPERKGYTFEGWKGYYNGKLITFSGGEMVKNLTTIDGGVIQLTAQWKLKDNYYALKFYDGNKLIQEDSVLKGDKYKLPTPPYSGETMTMSSGWKFTQNGTTTTHKAKEWVLVTGNTDFYAVWNTFTIRFDPHANGETVTDMPSDITAPMNTVVTLPDDVPHRDGYRFSGWGTKGVGNDVLFAYAYDPGDVYDVAVNVTLYALWDEIIVSPLKDVLQNKYTKAIMPDKYFLENYKSSSWQKINDDCYFIIMTDTTNASYDTSAFFIYREDYKIYVKEYYNSGLSGIIETWIIENRDNIEGAALGITVDCVVEIAKNVFANSNPVAAVMVYGYDGYCMVKDVLESDAFQKFISFEGYVATNGLAHVDEYGRLAYTINFEILDDTLDAATILGMILDGVSRIYDTYQAEQENLDPNGDRDASLSLFSEHIKACGFSSAIYGSGLKDVVNKMYKN